MAEQPQPEFKIDDAARIIGNLIIENDVLRRGLLQLKEEQEALQKRAEEVLQQRPKGPTLAVVEREDPGASTSGQT